jgi:5-methylcytosine-specific restriction endonuclease McrA
MNETPPPTLMSLALIAVTRILERLQESLRNAQSAEFLCGACNRAKGAKLPGRAGRG